MTFGIALTCAALTGWIVGVGPTSVRAVGL